MLTNKGTRGRARFSRRVALRILRELRRGAGPDGLVLVHGAGSFAHPLAVRYGIGKRRLTGRRLEDAVAQTQDAVRALRTHVLAACADVGLPAVDLPASALAHASGGRVRLDADAFRRALARGLVPVTGCDAVLDDRRGARVLSGDEILSLLAKTLGARRAVFVGDVDGVRLGRRVAKALSAARAKEVAPRLSVGSDATGGMRGKLLHAAAIAAGGVPVLLVNGLVSGRAEAAARGRRVAGTRIS